jgi:hypothetical protein
LGNVVIPYVKRVSENFRRIWNWYNIRMVLKTNHTLRWSIVKTRPDLDPLKTIHCIYSIPCECGRCYIGETSRPLGVCLKEHQHNLKQGLLENFKLPSMCIKKGTVSTGKNVRVLQV